MQKFCTDCVYHYRGPGLHRWVICTNPRFRHPTGRWLDLEDVRMNERFCGVDGQGYVERKKKPRPVSFWARLFGARQVDGEA